MTGIRLEEVAAAGTPGVYTLTLSAAGSGIVDAAGNPLVGGATDTWTIGDPDTDPPTADIVDVAPDPRNSTVGQLTIVFSEPISGLDLGDLSLKRERWRQPV